MTWWFCADQEDAEKYVWIDADRWYDARRTAWQLLGSEKLWITHPKTEQTRPPKKAYTDHAVYEAHWEGSAAGLSDLRMEVDRVLCRKWLCRICSGLFWPWDLKEEFGRLVHVDQNNISCGPVFDHRKAVSNKNLSSLPEAQPYPDEKVNGTTPVAPT